MGRPLTLHAETAEGQVGDPLVTFVIVTYNSADVLRDCLDALPGAVGAAGQFAVIVVDNGSADASLAIASSWGATRVVSTGRNAGYAAGVNAGCRHSDPGAPVMILNPDVRLSAGSVGPMLQTLTGQVGIVVPLLLDSSGQLVPSLRREPSVLRALGEAVLGGRLAGRIPALGEVVVARGAYSLATRSDWATGCAVLIAPDCRRVVGEWDERFFLYSEETDFAARARDAGFLLALAPGASATHLGGESRTSPTLWALLTRNRIDYFRGRHGLVASAAFRLAVVVNELLRALGGSDVHRAGLAAAARPWGPGLRLRAARAPLTRCRGLVILCSDRKKLAQLQALAKARSAADRVVLVDLCAHETGESFPWIHALVPGAPGVMVLRPMTGHRSRPRVAAAQVRAAARVLGLRDASVIAEGEDAESVRSHLGASHAVVETLSSDPTVAAHPAAEAG